MTIFKAPWSFYSIILSLIRHDSAVRNGELLHRFNPDSTIITMEMSETATTQRTAEQVSVYMSQRDRPRPRGDI